MRPLLKFMLVLALIFASTFLIVKFTGIITIDKIEVWLTNAKQINNYLISLIVITILFADLFIAVPTLTVMIFAGYFLGPITGALTSIIGVLVAGITGYVLSYYYGEKLLFLIIKNKQERLNATNQFKQYGFIMILLSRAMPIIPEVTACMAGVSKMPAIKFVSAWLIGSVPYAIVATYAGSVSTLDNPKPAIFSAIALSCLLWVGWYILQMVMHKNHQQKIKSSG